MLIPEKNLKKMIGNDPYYLKINKTEKYRFNVWASLLGTIWMVYRNMYFTSVLWMYIISIVQKIIMISPYLKSNNSLVWVDLFYRLFIGVLANQVYFYFLKSMNQNNIIPATKDKRAVTIVVVVSSIIGAYIGVMGALQHMGYLGQDNFFVPQNWGFFMMLIVGLTTLASLWLFGKEKRPEVFFFPFPQMWAKIRNS